MTRAAHRKPNAETKECLVCGNTFRWRKKQMKLWDEVRFCTYECRIKYYKKKARS